MKSLKTLLVAASLMLATSLGFSQNTLFQFTSVGTNVMTGTTALVPMHVYQVTVIATNATANVTLNDSAYATNTWSVPEYVSYATYSSNIVNNYVDGTGVTNYLTNAVAYTLVVTNAAADALLTPKGVFTAPANTAITYNTDMIFLKGIQTVQTTNCSLLLLYRPLR